MVRVQDTLSNKGDSGADDENSTLAPQAAAALKEKRLTFTWLDGEAQQVSYLSTRIRRSSLWPNLFWKITINRILELMLVFLIAEISMLF